MRMRKAITMGKKHRSSNSLFVERKWESVKALTEYAMFDFIELSPALSLMATTTTTPALQIV